MSVNVDQVNVHGALLESEEAARRLGVKLQTLYAYVSRGRLQSYAAPGSKRRLFSVDEVESLARRARGGKQVETRVATVTTAITQLRTDGPAYRGQLAATLAATSSFEQTAELLWGSGSGAWEAIRLTPPRGLGSQGILRWIAVMAAARDPRRDDPFPDLVTARLRSVISTMACLCGPKAVNSGASPNRGQVSHIAWILAEGLRTRRLSAPTVRAINAALILVADHELATSALAVRIAASTRATIYDALLAGLGTMGGPLHGGASAIATRMLRRTAADDVSQVIDDLLLGSGVLPGFGHVVYPDGDPRADALLSFVRPIAGAGKWKAIVEFLDAADARRQPPPNIDFALAALAFATDMSEDSVTSIFTIGRVAGWGAHYLEEIQEPPLRYRARAIYAANESTQKEYSR